MCRCLPCGNGCVFCFHHNREVHWTNCYIARYSNKYLGINWKSYRHNISELNKRKKIKFEQLVLDI